MTGNQSRFDRESESAGASVPGAATTAESDTAATNGQATATAQSPRMLTRICIALAVVLLIALLLARTVAQQFDFSVANILTLILGFFSWLSLTVGLASSQLPKWLWRTVAFAPIILIMVGLSLYRVVRINGELVPQFESRWKPEAKLVSTSPSERPERLPASLIEPRDTDFPQFLGLHRNGVVDNVKLDTDWKAHPPEVLWKQPIGAGWSGFAVQGDVAVTLEQREKEQWVSCYEVESGRLLWHTAIPGYHFNPLGGAGPRSTPTIADNRVYVHMATGPLACLELATGEKVWEVNLVELGGWGEDSEKAQEAAEKDVSWGRSGSPLVVRDMVVVPLGGPGDKKNSLIALRTSDGKVVWRAGSDQVSYSSPMLTKLLGVEQIVIVNETSITGHEIETGDVLWSVPWPGQSTGSANVSQPVWVDDSHLLFSKGYLKGCQLVEFSLDADGKWAYKEVWHAPSSLKTKLTTAVIRDGFAYGLSDGILECIRVSDGEQQWKKGRYRHGQVLLVDDVLLITAENGSIVLVAADPQKFRELAKQDVMGDVTWNTPALSGNRLLMRNAEEA
ncbi:MAG: outer membrane protein assembly factor BamB family protein, partial [Aureliella sp.]